MRAKAFTGPQISLIKEQYKDASITRPIWCLFGLLFEGGLRPSEVLKIRLEDVTTKDKTVYLAYPSKNSDLRLISISKPLTALLRALIDSESDQSQTISSLILGPLTGGSMKNKLEMLFTRFKNKVLGFDKQLTLYSFRHTYGSRLYRKTLDPMFVKQAMGHKSLASTQYYIEKLKSKDVADKVADILGGSYE